MCLVTGTLGAQTRPAPTAAPTPIGSWTVVPQLRGMGRSVDTAATAARRRALLARIGRGVVLIPAAQERDLELDCIQDNDFRQNNTFFYFTELESQHAWLLMTARGRDSTDIVLFLPPRNPAQERWTGIRLGPDSTADVMRSWPVSGKFTSRQKAIYDLVLGSQQAAFDAVRPGVKMATLDSIARAHMKSHSGTLCGDKICDAYFIHGLGHWIGMDVRDVGDNTTPLAPGMVFTIEPGIYLPAESLGVRIEDDVLVTATGGEWLSAGAPRSTEEIERVMREARSGRR